MKDSFSAYHPFLNLFYFAVVIGLGMFLVHPVYVAISFVCACCYNAMLLGFQKGVLERLRLLLPLMLLTCLPRRLAAVPDEDTAQIRLVAALALVQAGVVVNIMLAIIAR